jgi:pimeloyl-ACP methyl ester carboxylesterase
VKNTREAAVSDFIAPDVTPPAVVKAFAEQALAADPVYAEWKIDRYMTLTAASLRAPVLVIHGEKDPGADVATAAEFLAAVSTGDKRYVVLPGADHCAQLEDTHDAFVAAVADFVTATRRARRSSW